MGVTKRELIKALRCSSSVRQHRCNKDCPYFTVATEEKRMKFLENYASCGSTFPDDFWESCDVDKMAMDAADMLEDGNADSDLISRVELFNKLANANDKGEIFAIINGMPTVDDVCTHGKWIPSDIEDTILDKCSVCGWQFGAITFNYCPKCGARMDGDTDDE